MQVTLISKLCTLARAARMSRANAPTHIVTNSITLSTYIILTHFMSHCRECVSLGPLTYTSYSM
jgi:hypothetical protein